MCFLAELLLLKLSNETSLNYLYVALLLNFMYFILGMKVTGKEPSAQKIHNKAMNKVNVLLAGFAIAVILFQIFFLPNSENIYVGKICVIVCSILSVLLFMADIFFAFRKLANVGQDNFITMLHMFGMISLLFFMINQLHSLYDVSEYTNLVLGSLGIYIETIVFCFISYFKQIYAKE